MNYFQTRFIFEWLNFKLSIIYSLNNMKNKIKEKQVGANKLKEAIDNICEIFLINTDCTHLVSLEKTGNMKQRPIRCFR